MKGSTKGSAAVTTTVAEVVAQYAAGQTFACTWRAMLNPETGAMSEPCGTEILMHGMFWCGQVCPKCLTTYHKGWGASNNLYQDHGFYPADVKARIVANIAANGGQYVPTF